MTKRKSLTPEQAEAVDTRTWVSHDPREVLWYHKNAFIVIHAFGSLAIARVRTKGASNPYNIDFETVEEDDFVFGKIAYDGLDVRHNWPDGWEWTALPHRGGSIDD